MSAARFQNASDDDPRLQKLLQSLESDAAPVDPAALASIRNVAGDAFEAAAAEKGVPRRHEGHEGLGRGVIDGVRSGVVRPSTLDPRRSTHSPEKRRMFVIARYAAVCAAACVGLVMWFAGWFGGGPAEAATFGEVLRKLEAASVWHFEFRQGDSTAEVWVRQPGEVRWQDGPARYQIARGSRLWRIDEQANQATAEDSPWFTAAGEGVDLFVLIGLDDVKRTELVGQRPAGREDYDGKPCRVYRFDIPQDGTTLQLSAYADAQTDQLLGLVVTDTREKEPARPRSEMRLIAVDEPVDESLFVVAKTLTEDGRIGKVLDAQGIVSLKPVMNRRWTPVTRQVLLKPGDWVRTDVRGANATRAALTTSVQVTVGPASLVEFISPHEARLHQGEVQLDVAAALEEPFRLLGPREASVEVTEAGKQIIRVARDESLSKVDQPPLWLQGFEGTTTNESLGELLVNVNGENVSLSVGYHYVSVEVRDQIARTTIEESFVNHTDVRLEGIFHFPLPQDASISGFGMWIGDELVEADVVEKQRAREIYEQILREKRDPGLLEWTGGNIFKARVFPIEAHSEKRIKIVYTQVLPLRGNKYRYSYGLNSELLKTTPLRELSLDVLVNSALPLKGVECPTHGVRQEMTPHSAHVEFTAQEYVPERDFEVVFELDRRQSDVVVIPHRRGEDGYFLIQLMPPGPEGNFQRDVLPDGQPLDLLLLCDTSASMDATKRQQQSEFVAALLASLAEQDRFRLAGCDVSTVWGVAEPTAAGDESRAAAAKFLSDRRSLGWTDLDQAFAAVKEKLGPKTQVVYIGDGIVSTGDADPAAFVNRLKRLFGALDPQPSTLDRPAFHAVTVGNSYESVALKGIAALGGGSMRAVSGEQTPPMVALELLNELAQPGLRDINLEFRGLKVAAVYPETLPNVPAGTQQIIVGRYLPEGKDQSGEVVVTGRLNGEPVRYAAQVTLADAKSGNSFIPRLWARAHLDHLLAQGQSPFIRDEIIGLSEEFHIITPYTSLLVLESDADRERFGVKRRYEMRDGEKFFAEGRDNATYELVQQQMRRAGDWRIGLRRQVLRELSRLGRDAEAFVQLQQMPHVWDAEERLGTSIYSVGDLVLPASGPMSMSGARASGRSWNEPWGGRSWFDNGRLGGLGGFGGGGFGSGEAGDVSRFLGAFDESGMPEESKAIDEFAEADKKERAYAGAPDPSALDDLSLLDPAAAFSPDGAMTLAMPTGGAMPMTRSPYPMLNGFEPYRRRASLDFRDAKLQLPVLAKRLKQLSDRQEFNGEWFSGGFYGHSRQPDYLQWVNQLFPALPAPPTKPTRPVPAADWPADVRAITDTLYTLPALQQIDGGLVIDTTTDTRDPRWNRDTGRSESLELYSRKAWLTRPAGIGPDRIVNWCDEQERGVFSATFGFGRIRASEPAELTTNTTGANYFGGRPLHEIYHNATATIVSQDNGLTVIEILYRQMSPPQGIRLTIDTRRRIVLKSESLHDGKVLSTTTNRDLVEVHGLWWPTRSVTTDADGQVTFTVMRQISPLSTDDFRQRMDSELSPRPQVLFIRLPFVDLDTAKQKVADGSAGFNEHLAVLLHFTLSQQWDEVRARLASIEQIDAGKPGLTWLKAAIWPQTQSNEDVRQLLLAETRRLVENRRDDEWAVFERIRGTLYPLTDWNEFGELMQVAKPIYDRQPELLFGPLAWQRQWLAVLQSLGRSDEAMALLRGMAERTPWELDLQTQYANQLAGLGDHEAAYDWLDSVLARETRFESWEHQNIYQTYDQLLRNQARFDRLIEVIEGWMRAQPAANGSEPYSRYLSAILFSDDVDRAEGLVRQWVAEGRRDGKPPDDVKSRMEAAVSYTLGQTYNLYWHRVDARWLPLLKETVAFHIRQPESFQHAATIMGNSSFRDSDEADAVVRELLPLVKTEAGMRDPSQLHQMIGWLLSGQVEVTTEEWQAIAAPLRERWQTETDDNRRHTLGEALVSIYSSRFADTEYLPFLRTRIENGPAVFRAQYISALFEALLTRNWTAEIEAEAFALLPRLQEPSEPKPWEVIAADDHARQESLIAQLLAQISGLHRLVDRMIEARTQAEMTKLQDTGHPENLTRQELAAKEAEYRKAAREGVWARLGTFMATWIIVDEARPEGAPQTIILQTLADWAEMEALYLNVVLQRDLEQVAATCWTLLGDAPPNLAEAPEQERKPTPELATPIEWTRELLDGMRRQRALATVMNLAARRSAAPESVARVVAYLDAGSAQGGDDEVLWKHAKYTFLIALDRPDDLAAALRAWIAEDEFTAPWRVALAKLQAERGELKEAIELLEAVKQKDELAPAELRLLSDWYQVVDRRADYERARVEALKVMEEWQLQQFVQGTIYQWQSSEGPRGNYVEDDALFALRALLEKSGSPGSYLGSMGQLYRVSRDFRVMQMLPDAMLGRTPQQAYSMLHSLNSALEEVRKEATSDEIIARIAVDRNDAKSAIDHRALDLLEAIVERRAAEVLNQPGPHAQAALAAMQRAFDHDWADGERRQMAGWLASLGAITHPALREEQLRELRTLAAATEPGTDDGLWMTYYLCQALFNYGQHDAAIAQMQTAVRAYEQSHASGWPEHANDPLSGYVRFLEQRRSYTTGEDLLRKHLVTPLNGGQRYWLAERLDGLYLDALQNDGQVSLGVGETLFKNLARHVLDECQTPDDNHRSNLIYRLNSVYRTAADKKYPTAKADLRQFAFETLPELLKLQDNSYSNLIQNVAQALRDVIAPRTGLEFLVARMEDYPRRYEYSWDRPWNQYSYYLAQWLYEDQHPGDNKPVRPLGELDGRLLKLVLVELRRDLLQREAQNRSIYSDDHYYYWSAHAADYLRVAEEVYAERKHSGRSVKYIAEYVCYGLEHRNSAIEMLFVAMRDGILDDAGRQQLITYLFEAKRHAEAVPILEPLVAKYPDTMSYRTQLMEAYFHSQRPGQVTELLAATVEHFQQEGRWTEGNVAALAQACLNCQLYADAVTYFTIAIDDHKRTAPNQGIGDGTLSYYFQQLAAAHSALHETAEAVDAASAAIVSWGADYGSRQDALRSLENVLRHAQDLDQYVAAYDEKATKQDSPILRKAIGNVYKERNSLAAAARNFELALELAPGDSEIYAALLQCYDQLERKEDAVGLLLAQIDVERHNLALYNELARRLADDPARAERAATSIVEASPLEAENQQALAELRGTQDRWADAVKHWGRAAELRALEPNGLLGLADAQLHAGDKAAAQETLRKLRMKEWPARFDDLLNQKLPELQRRAAAR